eukprot:1119460-Rhodomonas_salina.1
MMSFRRKFSEFLSVDFLVVLVVSHSNAFNEDRNSVAAVRISQLVWRQVTVASGGAFPRRGRASDCCRSHPGLRSESAGRELCSAVGHPRSTFGRDLLYRVARLKAWFPNSAIEQNPSECRP